MPLLLQVALPDKPEMRIDVRCMAYVSVGFYLYILGSYVDVKTWVNLIQN